MNIDIINITNDILEILGFKVNNLDNTNNTIIYDLNDNQRILNENEGLNVIYNDNVSNNDINTLLRERKMFLINDSLQTFRNSNVILGFNNDNNVISISLNPITKNITDFSRKNEIQVQIFEEKNDFLESLGFFYENRSLKTKIRFFIKKDKVLYVNDFNIKMNEETGNIELQIKKYNLEDNLETLLDIHVLNHIYYFADKAEYFIDETASKALVFGTERIIDQPVSSENNNYPLIYQKDKKFSIIYDDSTIDAYLEEFKNYLNNYNEFSADVSFNQKINLLLPILKYFIKKMLKYRQSLMLNKTIEFADRHQYYLNDDLKKAEYKHNENTQEIKRIEEEIKLNKKKLEQQKQLQSSHQESSFFKEFTKIKDRRNIWKRKKKEQQ